MLGVLILHTNVVRLHRRGGKTRAEQEVNGDGRMENAYDAHEHKGISQLYTLE